MENLIKFLKNRNQTISCMESCTGGMLSSEITNIDGSSDVFNVGLVTYSNNWKEYFGVNKETIETYTVYSINVAKEMAKAVSELAKSDWGIGITGQLGKKDLKNNSNKLNTVYFAICAGEKSGWKRICFRKESCPSGRNGDIFRIRMEKLTALIYVRNVMTG